MNKVYGAYCRSYQAVFRVVSKALDWTGPQVLKGPGSVKKLPSVLKGNGIKNVMIVTDKGLHSLGLLNSLKEGLETKGINYVVYDGTQPNPTIPNVEEARELYINHNCEAVIAFGGGSPMDCAKVAAARVAAPGKMIPSMRGTLKVLTKLPPLYAVPTTAGTGSETTIAAVIVNPETHEKFAINDPCLRPKMAVLDPELTVGLPPHITSTTGMDALTHAVEAYIGLSNTPATKAAAEKAVKMIFANLEIAYNEPKNIEARDNMLNASFYAGIAFTQAYVGYVHAIAHNLGGFYNIPHGLANAIILPYVLRYYGEDIYDKLADLADIADLKTEGMSREEKANFFIDEICAMNARMKIPSSFDCIKEEDIPTIAERAMYEANPLYPVPKLMDEEQCQQIIRSMMF